MNYDLIFYLSRKTSYCERALTKQFSLIGGEKHRVLCATTPVALGEEVSRGLRTCPLTVIIGGLRSDDDDNLATVLSRVFSNSSLTLENMRKLSADGEEGYIIRYRNQILLALPDSPDAITKMCGRELLHFIRDKLSAGEEPVQETNHQQNI